MNYEFEYLFICLLAISISSFMKCLFKIFAHLGEQGIFLLLTCRSFCLFVCFNIFWIQALCKEYILKHFLLVCDLYLFYFHINFIFWYLQCFESSVKKHLFNTSLYSPAFSSRNFTVSAFMFKTIIHLELIFVWDSFQGFFPP